jgi:hypothetical protein
VCLEEMDGRHRQKEDVGLNAIYGAFAVTTRNHCTISSLSRFAAETRQSAAPLASAKGAGISARNARWATLRLSVLPAWLAVGQFIG